MFTIEMGGYGVVVAIEWLTLGSITMDLKELYTSFNKEGCKHALKGILFNSPKIISAHLMEKFSKKGHLGIIAQFNAIRVMDNSP